MLHTVSPRVTMRTEDVFGALTSFEAKNAPEHLYLAGDVALLTEGRRVSVVGSRKPSMEGAARARAVTRALVEEGIIVVSGLAEGIDTIAHETAIASGGRTVAVLGNDLGQAYPKKNEGLLATIISDHLAISQFPDGTPPSRTTFPQRNRTMALISDATIIVEAGENSGTRHQGWEALRIGRIVFLLQSVIENPALTWPKEMIGYGAQVLSREDLPQALNDIPGFTSAGNFAF